MTMTPSLRCRGKRDCIIFPGIVIAIGGNQNDFPKGQLISKCLFEKIVWTKIATKNLIDSAQQV